MYKKIYKNIIKDKRFKNDIIINFSKYSALGNDYIVIDPNKNDFEQNTNVIANICDRNFGIGADGILLGPIFDKDSIHKKSQIPFVRIFNSDGSEAEKSGNGLRIFSQYLLDNGYIKNNIKKNIKEVYIKTLGGIVKSTYNMDGTISIEMGKIEFLTKDDIEIKADDSYFNGTYLSIGNPHFVIILDEISEKLAKKYGPFIESNSFFSKKTNVQFVKILDKNRIKIEIYERGSGYTLASGSSACAAAAASFKKKFVENNVEVMMRGGNLKVEINNDYNITQTGSVKHIFWGNFFISTFLDKFQN